MALSDTHALIGSPVADGVGQATLFDLSTGAVLHELQSPNPLADGDFGTAVAVSDRLTAVSANLTRQTGEVYVFDVGTGALLQTAANPTPNGYENFGRSISLRGDRLLIGASGDEEYPGGAAYLYRIGREEPVAIFTHPDGNAEGSFGTSVSLSGAGAAIGAYVPTPFEPGKPPGPDASEPFVLDLAGGEAVTRHAFGNAEEASGYAVNLALAEDYMAVAIERDDPVTTGGGSVYLLPAP